MPRIYIPFILIALALLSCGGSRLSSGDVRLYNTLPDKKLAENALSYFIDFKYHKAIDTYAIILARTNAEPSFRAWARYETGFCYYYLKKFSRAREEFERVIRDFPEPVFTSQRVLAEMLIGKIDEGRTDGI
ncbi:MAG: tetratricopeptide repeat protein [Spirochaetota bacterium]|jgi:outer membrane protein assembly factor BamD (BamD/ComL family)|nr:tetratricopeptide repeat protein [Spirochaetota bacterium]